ncbi:hypothetical protein F5X71_24915 [Nocardia brasiliensis]|uniref:Uncharacterized protein n=1 Tax=Nocardia brasiliensis TaxID=37326 RepID=A0A6G9XW80_NOCBR|nr:hypothetical protein [Nocardia brasiliensis]QIS05127.1 hypothetical protein F5X71_24915 [Nocardia brasiliensis]
MIARNTIRGFVVASSAAAAITAAPGFAGAAITIPPSSATLLVEGSAVTAALTTISSDLPDAQVQCTLLIDGDPQQNTLSERAAAPADFTLRREVGAGDHLAVTYCADFAGDSQTPGTYPTLACAKVSMPAATIESLPVDRCFLPS